MAQGQFHQVWENRTALRPLDVMLEKPTEQTLEEFAEVALLFFWLEKGSCWRDLLPHRNHIGSGVGCSHCDPGEGKGQHIWSILPRFDPSTDSARECIEKVKFIDGISINVGTSTRLAMLCRGTAWGQVKSLPAPSLVDEVNGVKTLLTALSTWEGPSEMRTFELFERAIYKTTQRPDESSLSFVNRLQVAFNELGSTTIDEMRAFLLLRQSALTSEDKKKVLTMTQGKMDKGLIEQSMRTLATSILSGEPKKKIYPVNYVKPEVKEIPENDSTVTAYYTNVDEEDVDQESIEQWANQGDADALQVQAFEKDLEDLFQEIPDRHQALIS